MKRFLIISMVIVFSVIGVCSSHSEELTAEEKADIVKLFELTGVRKTSELIANQVSQQILLLIHQKNPSLPAKTLNIVREEMAKIFSELTTQKGGLSDLLVEIYHRHLDDKEIRGLIAFYETPLGKKLIEVTPAISQESVAAGMAWGQRMAPILNQRITDRLKKEGINIQI